MNMRPIVPLALLGGIVIGFFLGRGEWSPSPDESREEIEVEPGTTLMRDQARSLRAGEILDLVSLSTRKGMTEKMEFLRKIEHLEPDVVREMIESLFSGSFTDRERELVTALYSRWFNFDRQAALEDAVGRQGRGANAALEAVFQCWSETAPDEAWVLLEQMEGIPSGVLWKLQNVVVTEIARNNPARALELVTGSSSTKIDRYQVAPIIRAWAQSDPLAAAEAIQQFPASISRAWSSQLLAREWAHVDPEAAWEWAADRENAQERESAMQSVLDAAMQEDWRLAVSFFGEMPPSRKGERMLKGIVESIAEDSPGEAYEFARQHAKGAGSLGDYRGLWYNWARLDPDEAFRIALRDRTEGDSSWSNTFSSILSVVSQNDLAKATEMLGEIDDSRAFQKSAQSIVYNMIEKDPLEAVEWAQGLPPGEARTSVVATAMGGWGGNEPEAAARFALDLSDPAERDSSLRSVIVSWAQKDPGKALQWATENLADDQSKQRVLPRVVGRLANSNVEEAAQWVSNQPEGDIRKDCAGYLVSEWSRIDYAAAGEWLNQLDHGPSRDAAVDTFARNIFKQDRNAAKAWVESISESEKRETVLRSLAISLSRTDPPAARQWLASTSLSPAQQAEVRKEMNE